MARTVLYKLETGFAWFDETQDGNVKLKCPVMKRDNGWPVSSFALLALALTSVCCELRSGKVYCLFSNIDPPDVDDASVDAFAVYSTMMSEPGLLYVPEDWPAERVAEWESMTPYDQFHHCWATNGWMQGGTLGLPFSAVVHETARSCAGLDKARFLSTTKAPVMVCLPGDRVYAGLSSEIFQKCRVVSISSAEGPPLESNYVPKRDSWRTFRSWERAGLDGVVTFLEDTMRAKPELCELYGDVVKRVHQAQSSIIPARKRHMAVKATEKKAAEDDREQRRRENLVRREALRAAAATAQ